jgi:hypothetical protein
MSMNFAALATIVAGGVCCLAVVTGVVLLVVWAVRRSRQT